MVYSIILNWLLIGYFISVKRNWYADNKDKQVLVAVNFIFSPLALVVAFVKVFIIGEWKNDNEIL
jgi:hypothetical protein